MSAWLINLAGLILMAWVIWWFILAKAGKAIGKNLTITVCDGVYEPAIIQAKQGQAIELTFLRKDSTPCSEVVIFEQLPLSAKLPFDKPCRLNISPQKAGEYDFRCQMGMYRGKLIVVK